MRFRLLASALIAVALLGVASLGSIPAAWAHASQAESTPAAGATLETPPETVVVRFDSPLMDVGAALVVRAADGTVVSDPTPTIERNAISVAVATDAGPGTYTVAYRVVSADGHTVTSSFTYAVAGASASATAAAPTTPAPTTPAPAPEPAATTPPEPGGANVALLALGALLVLAVAAAAVLLVARTRRTP